jgi:hypothetical protein
MEDEGRKFTKGCLIGVLLSIPIWIGIGYIVWRWISG